MTPDPDAQYWMFLICHLNLFWGFGAQTVWKGRICWCWSMDIMLWFLGMATNRWQKWKWITIWKNVWRSRFCKIGSTKYQIYWVSKIAFGVSLISNQWHRFCNLSSSNTTWTVFASNQQTFHRRNGRFSRFYPLVVLNRTPFPKTWMLDFSSQQLPNM